MLTGVGATSEDRREDIDAAAVAAYRASIDTGRPLSERKLAAIFGKTSRRWARGRRPRPVRPTYSTSLMLGRRTTASRVVGRGKRSFAGGLRWRTGPSSRP